MRAATEILAEVGISGLNAVALCERLGVTRGSFYHHFKSLADFEEKFLDYWENVVTTERTSPVEVGTTFHERSEAAIRTLLAVDLNAERALRAWSLTDERVAQMLSRTDRRAYDVVRRSILSAGATEEMADTYAEMVVTIWVGLVTRPTQLAPATIRRIFGELMWAVDAHTGTPNRT